MDLPGDLSERPPPVPTLQLLLHDAEKNTRKVPRVVDKKLKASPYHQEWKDVLTAAQTDRGYKEPLPIIAPNEQHLSSK
eukprot:2901654-Alexandrium_andersonii.AAC.1